MDDDKGPDTLLDDCDFLLELAEEAAQERYQHVAPPPVEKPIILPGTGYQPPAMQRGAEMHLGQLLQIHQPARPSTDQGFYVEKLSGLKVTGRIQMYFKTTWHAM